LSYWFEEVKRPSQPLTHNELWGEDEQVTSVWYQAEFYSELDKCWVPLGGKAMTWDGAREAYEKLTGSHQRRIVKVTYITVVLKGEEA
jgi:hypothetical protein